MMRCRFTVASTKLLSSIRYCHDKGNKLVQPSSLQESDPDRRIMRRDELSMPLVEYWSEKAAVRKQKRDNRFPRTVKDPVDLVKAFQSLKNFPTSLSGLMYFIANRRDRKEVIAQKYLPRRVAVLKPDLAAAHFLLARQGSVRFVGLQNWVGPHEEKKSLPMTYVPGLFIESIKAERTNLYYEGLENLKRLRYLKYLSLKNLHTMNDWCMDWISKEYYMSLKHLDLTGCVNVTYRGLSCFYRFECLETLNVEGIPDSPEFKLACLMLLEIMPDLDIKGIDLGIPEKIELNEAKLIQNTGKEIKELTP